MMKNPIVQGMIEAIKGVSGALKGLFRKGRGISASRPALSTCEQNQHRKQQKNLSPTL